MTQSTPAGWYPDPQDPNRLRYFDGAAWTQHVAPVAPAPPAGRSAKGTAPKVLLTAAALLGAWLLGAVIVTATMPSNLSTPRASSVETRRSSLEIPAPASFVRLTPAMSELYTLQSKFVYSGNEDLGCFITAEDAEAALAGERPYLARRFSAQAPKGAGSSRVSQRQFREVTDAFEDGLPKQFADVQDELAEPIAEAGAALSEYMDVDFTLEPSSTVPFPAHISNDRMYAFSAIQNYEVQAEEGTSAFAGTCTSTLLYVDQRILFLYVFGEEDDLEWTREQSKKWADAILDANAD